MWQDVINAAKESFDYTIRLKNIIISLARVLNKLKKVVNERQQSWYLLDGVEGTTPKFLMAMNMI